MRVHQSLVDDCGRRMQYKLETPEFYGGSVRALGSGYHKALEEYYLERQETGFFEPPVGFLHALIKVAQEEFDALVEGGVSHVSENDRPFGGFKWNKAIPDHESAHQALDVMVRAYFDPDNPCYFPDGWGVLGVEQFFDLPWTEQHTRGGSIDLIMADPNGWVVGEDHKTAGRGWNKGKESPRKNLQAAWYNKAIQDLYPGYAGYRSTFGIMKYNGQFERRISDPEPRHIEAAERLLLDVVNQYTVVRANDLDMPANPSSNLCSPEYCDYFNVCPHGAVLEV